MTLTINKLKSIIARAKWNRGHIGGDGVLIFSEVQIKQPCRWPTLPDEILVDDRENFCWELQNRLCDTEIKSILDVKSKQEYIIRITDLDENMALMEYDYSEEEIYEFIEINTTDDKIIIETGSGYGSRYEYYRRHVYLTKREAV